MMPHLEEGTKRILTTHTGSLPRPEALSELLFLKMSRKPHDTSDLCRRTQEAVTAIVRKQKELGLDIVSDGEQSKTSFQLYVTERLDGIDPITPATGEKRTRENIAFPTFYSGGAHSGSQRARWACTGPITYANTKPLQEDLNNLKAALAGDDPVDAFVPSVSPSSCAGLMENHYYKSEDDHVEAVGEALRHEYEAIVAAGFCVQVDDPRLAMHYMLSPEESVEDARRWAAKRIEALNYALRNVPPDRVRHHTCYGINMGPRVSDLELKHLADLLVGINARYYSFEMANPRHEHEWRVWESVKLPEDKVLMPGCVTHASVIVEHPQVVAGRIVQLANVVGRERVIASTDCGFASTLKPAERPEIEPEIVWAKFEALREGARLATKELWMTGA
jgi:5-methyltetrahydropteroyltriglutamate--homocysteine methyltransferase